MKVELDVKPVTNSNPRPRFAIRLYPETNEEMANLEWGLNVMGKVDDVCKSFNSKMMYSVIFKEKE